MKKLLTVLSIFSMIAGASAQHAPQKFNYQAVARAADGTALTNQEVTLRVAIMDETDPDRPLYEEEHLVVTGKLGVFNLQIGGGEAIEGSFEHIEWGSAAHYLSVQMDAEGFGSFQQMGTSQLLSVPYALYAERSGSFSNGDNGRSDPNDWTMSGNAGTDDATDFIGTTDAQDLVFKTNDAENGRFTTDGDLDLATDSRILVNGDNLINALGTSNIHIGKDAGEISSGSYNVLVGEDAGASVTTGSYNMILGYSAGTNLTTANQNVMLGYGSGGNTTTGGENLYLGQFSGASGTTAEENVFVGAKAGYGNVSGTRNVAIGSESARYMTGNYNLTIGFRSGYVTTGTGNVFQGYNSGRLNTSGSFNTFLGYSAGSVNTTGGYNVALGRLAGTSNTTGSNNTYIGYQADGSADLTNATAIGAFATVEQDSSIVLGNNAKVGIGTSTPDADLHLVGSLKLVDGNQADGYVLTSDSLGNSSWQAASGSGDMLEDSDGDTKIQVEESADEDIIRFDIAGTERLVVGANSDGNTTVQVWDASYNTFFGNQAGTTNSSGTENTFMGYSAGYANTNGDGNVFIGSLTGSSNYGDDNVFIGNSVGAYNSTSDNVFIGDNAAGYVNSGSGTSVIIGADAGITVDTIKKSVFLGYQAGYNIGDSDGNIFLGHQAGYSETGDNKLYIDNSSTSSPLIYGDFSNNELTINGSLAVVDGTQADGYVLTSDANGNASWQEASGSGDALEDADGDTKIQVEESADEDVIRFDVGGTEHFAMVGPTLEVLNTGSSVFIGDNAGTNDDLSNNQNVFVGNNAGSTSTTASACVAVGTGALSSNSTSGSNTAIGYHALYSTTATGNTAVGSNSLANNTSGQYNNGVGLNTLNAQTSGANYNNAFGSEALENNTTGDNNSAFGDLAMNFNTTGGANTVMGAQALENNQTGSYNVVIGYRAGENNTGSSNVFLGYNAGRSESGSNKLYIENTNSTSPLLYGEFDNDLIRINGELDMEGNIHTSGNFISNDGDDEGLYVSTDGNVGIGTSSPNHELQIYDSANDNAWLQFIQASTGTTTSDGFVIGVNSSEEANLINKEATNMNFYTNGTNQMTIDADGNIGVGTTSPDDLIHVQGTTSRVRAESTDGTYAGFVAENTNGEFFVGVQGTGDPNSGEFHIYSNSAGARRMVIDASGNVGFGFNNPSYKLAVNGQVAGTSAYVNTSDAKYKTNVQPIGAALEKLQLLEGVSYDWKTKEFPEKNFDARHQLGFIAQDVEVVLPEAVSITNEGDYGLSYSTFIPLLVEAVKELKAENDALKAENASYEERFKRIEARLGMPAQSVR